MSRPVSADRPVVRPPLSAPGGLPDALRCYLDHTVRGLSLRALARREGCHASTVMRQVRRYENRRDDPLMDGALCALGRTLDRRPPAIPEETPSMSATIRRAPSTDLSAAPSAGDEGREHQRILRRLAEPGAVLAIAADMPKAAVLRADAAGHMIQTAVTSREAAQAMAVRDWIACVKAGRLSSYRITAAGRSALAAMAPAQAGFAEAQTPFGAAGQPAEEAEADGGAQGRSRYGMAETPVQVLGRRRDGGGRPFLEPDLVEAAERLREDFELAQMGPRVAQDWERFLTGGATAGVPSGAGRADGPRAARDRVALALRELGPGLGDAALRCCCFLEGMETVEKRLAWPARSGKIVLRFALMRLRRHYDEVYGRSGPLIG